MTTPARWSGPGHWPNGATVSHDMTRVSAVLDPRVTVPTVLPAPVLVDEVQAWTKPPAAACFPLHEVGVLSLFSRAWTIYVQTGVQLHVSPDESEEMRRAIWMSSVSLYSSGRSIRSAIDDAIERGHIPLTTRNDEIEVAAKHANLAAWAVVRAASEWAAEASS